MRKNCDQFIYKQQANANGWTGVCARTIQTKKERKNGAIGVGLLVSEKKITPLDCTDRHRRRSTHRQRQSERARKKERNCHGIHQRNRTNRIMCEQTVDDLCVEWTSWPTRNQRREEEKNTTDSNYVELNRQIDNSDRGRAEYSQ